MSCGRWTDEQEPLEKRRGCGKSFPGSISQISEHRQTDTGNLAELIDYIKVYEVGNISVKFKYADEFRRMAEYIQLNALWFKRLRADI